MNRELYQFRKLLGGNGVIRDASWGAGLPISIFFMENALKIIGMDNSYPFSQTID